MPLDQIENEDYDQKEMSFFDHIDELRKYLFRSVLAIAIASVGLFLNKHFVFDVVLFGPLQKNFYSYQVLCKLSYMIKGTDEYCFKEIGFVLSNISMTGQFTQHLWISFIGGVIIAFPIILWQFWAFIKPALSHKEINYARGLVFYSSLLFFMGIGFGYFLLSPMSISFLGSYKVSQLVSNEINLESYVSFISTMTFATGLIFEMPILVYFLVKIGLIGASFMRKYRKHAFVIILVIAAIITPSPDIASMLMMALPLYTLYELSIFIAQRVEKNKAKK